MSGPSKSSSSPTTTTEDRKITAGNDAIIATEGSNLYVERIDADLVAEALGVTGDTAQRALDRMAELADTTTAGTLAFSADTIDQVTRLARDTNEGVFSLGSELIDTSADLNRRLVDSNADLATRTIDTLSTQANNFNTTLRDTLSTIFSNGENASVLAGSAGQSGGVSGWVARNPAAAAAAAFAGIAALALLSRKKP
jgi:hypothetical protein